MPGLLHRRLTSCGACEYDAVRCEEGNVAVDVQRRTSSGGNVCVYVCVYLALLAPWLLLRFSSPFGFLPRHASPRLAAQHPTQSPPRSGLTIRRSAYALPFRIDTRSPFARILIHLRLVHTTTRATLTPTQMQSSINLSPRPISQRTSTPLYTVDRNPPEPHRTCTFYAPAPSPFHVHAGPIASTALPSKPSAQRRRAGQKRAVRALQRHVEAGQRI